MSSVRNIVFDLETTGLSPARGDRVIEIGAVTVENGEITSEFSSLIQATRTIPWQATRVHGVTNKMLAGQPLPEEVFPCLRDFLAEGMLVAHNAPFDISFLRHEFDRLGYGLSNRHVCTLELARRRLPQLPNHRLETVYRHLFGSLPGGTQTHRALDDARLTARVWIALMQMA
jgi:DNA polymerase-3 subunit epsilon